MPKTLTTASGWMWLDNVDPGTSETQIEQGNWWLNTTTNNMFLCKVPDIGSQVWDRYPVSSVTVTNGGTGQTSLTQHAVLIGNGTDAITQLAVGSANSIFMGQNSDDPIFTTSGTPYVTGISFDNGVNSLSNYIGLTSFTPVLTGSITPGDVTYVTQIGRYSQIGNIIIGWINLQWSATTGTGTTLITGLPIAANAAITPVCSFVYAGIPIGGGLQNLIGQITNNQIAVSICTPGAPLTPLGLPPTGTLQCNFMYSI